MAPANVGPPPAEDADLHDSVAHALVAINVRAGVAAHLRARDDDGALRDIMDVSAAALDDQKSRPRFLGD